MSPLTHVVCSPRPPWPGCGVISIMKLALQDQILVGALDDGRAQLSAGWFTQADLSATGTPQAVLPAYEESICPKISFIRAPGFAVWPTRSPPRAHANALSNVRSSPGKDAQELCLRQYPEGRRYCRPGSDQSRYDRTKAGIRPGCQGEGCCGTGDLEILICSDAGLEWTIPLIL